MKSKILSRTLKVLAFATALFALIATCLFTYHLSPSAWKEGITLAPDAQQFACLKKAWDLNKSYRWQVFEEDEGRYNIVGWANFKYSPWYLRVILYKDDFEISTEDYDSKYGLMFHKIKRKGGAEFPACDDPEAR
jgi:hypothetical protein